MRGVLRYDPDTGDVLQACWTDAPACPRFEDDDGALPNQKEIVDPDQIVYRLALTWAEVGDAIKTACRMSDDRTALIRKSTGETLSALVDLES